MFCCLIVKVLFVEVSETEVHMLTRGFNYYQLSLTYLICCVQVLLKYISKMQLEDARALYLRKMAICIQRMVR